MAGTFIRRKFDGQTEVAYMLTLSATILCCIAFVTPFWLVSWPRIHTPLNSLGLWEFCLNGYVVRSDPSMRTYFGCWWIFAPEYAPIRHILTPSWFQAVQAFVTLELIANMVALLMFTLYVCRACDTRYPKHAKRWLKLLFALLVFSTLCSWISTILFGLCFSDEYWMPFHQLNYPHFSFYVHIICGGVVFSAALFLVRRIDVESSQAVTYEHEFKMVPSSAPGKTAAVTQRPPVLVAPTPTPRYFPVSPQETMKPLVSEEL